MSDGPSDCVAAANSNARKFVATKYAKVPQILTPTHAPAKGTVVLVYEEWLKHIVELITDRQVVERWVVEPFKDKPKRLAIGKDDWAVGYYREHHLPRKEAE